MSPSPVIRQRLEESRDLAQTLAAAHDAFNAMLSVFDSYQNGSGPFYAALVMAGPAAADGRNTVAMAPSLPPPERDRPWPLEPAHEPAAEEAADTVAVIAALAARKLRIAAAAASSAADRSACVEAAQYADEVRGLVTGTGP